MLSQIGKRSDLIAINRHSVSLNVPFLKWDLALKRCSEHFSPLNKCEDKPLNKTKKNHTETGQNTSTWCPLDLLFFVHLRAVSFPTAWRAASVLWTPWIRHMTRCLSHLCDSLWALIFAEFVWLSIGVEGQSLPLVAKWNIQRLNAWYKWL